MENSKVLLTYLKKTETKLRFLPAMGMHESSECADLALFLTSCSCLSPLIPQHFNVLIQHIILAYQSAKPSQLLLAMIAFNLLLITVILCFILQTGQLLT